MGMLAGRYSLDRPLGRGGMGEVWEGTDNQLERKVAVKLISGHYDREEDSRRFLRETKIMARMNHPGIPMVYDAGKDQTDGPYSDRLFLVMQLINGLSVRELVAENDALDPRWAAFIGAQACSAIRYAHDNGVIHRDIKPANLMLADDGSIKVIDFGVALSLDLEISRLTVTGQVVGSLAYMSPEQAAGMAVTTKSDLYSLGCVLYYMLTGQWVFERSTHIAMARAHVEDEPVPLRSVNPEVPTNLARLVHDLLEKDPDRRPSDAAEVYDRLLPFVDVLPVLPGVGSTNPTPVQQFGQSLGRTVESPTENPARPRTLQGSISLADLARARRQAERLVAQSDREKAIQVLSRAVTSGVRSYGQSHPEILNLRLALADLVTELHAG